MIRLFVSIGTIGVIALLYLVMNVGPERQLPPQVSLLKGFQEEGILPDPNGMTENEELEHDIFEVPPMDAVMLAAALEEFGDMSGMDMSGEQGAMDMGEGSTMEMAEGDTMMTMPDGSVMKESDMASEPMEMAEGTTMEAVEGDSMEMAEGDTMMTMPDGSVMKESDMASEPMEMAEGETMEAAEEATMEMADEAPHDEAPAEGGLLISEDGSFDREIKMTMSEWNFSDMQIEVKKGERIKFTIVNEGEIPHEFMFMTMSAMAAVNYRAIRADWSLLEHEALYEQSLVFPGGEFSLIMEVQEAGAWMFMCMLPWHMQMGMMGQMATPGQAMQMEM